MVAAPRYGVMSFVGLATRKTYSKDIYVGDVANALVNMDGGNGASSASPNEISFPEPVVLQDFAVATGLTDTTKIQLTRDNVPTGDMLRYALHIDTSNARPRLIIGFNRGQVLRAIQLA